MDSRLTIFDQIVDIRSRHRGLYSVTNNTLVPIPGSSRAEEGEAKPGDDLTYLEATRRYTEAGFLVKWGQETEEDAVLNIAYFGSDCSIANAYVEGSESGLVSVYRDRAGFLWRCEAVFVAGGSESSLQLQLKKDLVRTVSNDLQAISSSVEEATFTFSVNTRGEELVGGPGAETGSYEYVSLGEKVFRVQDISSDGKFVLYSQVGTQAITVSVVVDYEAMAATVSERPAVAELIKQGATDGAVEVTLGGTYTGFNMAEIQEDYEENLEYLEPRDAHKQNITFTTVTQDTSGLPSRTSTLYADYAVGACLNLDGIETGNMGDKIDYMVASMQLDASMAASATTSESGQVRVDLEEDTTTALDVAASVNTVGSFDVTVEVTAGNSVVWSYTASGQLSSSIEEEATLELVKEKDFVVRKVIDIWYDEDGQNVSGLGYAIWLPVTSWPFSGNSVESRRLSVEATAESGSLEVGKARTIEIGGFFYGSGDVDLRDLPLGTLEEYPLNYVFSYARTVVAATSMVNFRSGLFSSGVSADLASAYTSYSNYLRTNAGVTKVYTYGTIVAGNGDTFDSAAPATACICSRTAEVIEREQSLVDQIGAPTLITYKAPGDKWGGSKLPTPLLEWDELRAYVGYVYETETQ